MYGVWNRVQKEFQFGIKETSRKKTREKLFAKIGYDMKKDRFEIKKMPESKIVK